MIKFKSAAEIAARNLELSKPKLVHVIAEVKAYRFLDEPTMSDEIICKYCNSKEGYTPLFDRQEPFRRVWICGNGNCVTMKRENRPPATTTPVTPKRAILWASWCEINAIGDLHHDVTFEGIQQSAAKVTFLSKFASNPQGIILMMGKPGTGKTYACLGTCELFTRKSPYAIFITQRNLLKWWAEAEKHDKFINSLNTISLLVIDDFGTGEINHSFMAYLMDLLNTRLQWSNRGTIINTNLDIKKFNDFCGQALSDRIMTGQQFDFTGETRRKKTIL